METPKITHQIWMQGWRELPEKFHENVEKLHEMNPEYTHMKWDAETLREQCKMFSQECLEKYESFEHLHSKVDFGRYVVLYNYGGISIDTDMAPLRSIKHTPHMNEHDFLISEMSYPANLMGFKNNAVIICAPNNQVLKTGIERIINDKRTPKDFKAKEEYINETTGPIFIGRLVDEHKEKVKILSYKYYEPCSPKDPYCEIQDDSIMDHQHELSWTSSTFKYLMWLFYFVLHNVRYVILAAILYGLYFMYKRVGKKFTKRTL